jgi:hypothetical protein
MPILGAIGNASEYAYRGNLDDWPNEFLFNNRSNAEPGVAYTTGITTITGINYKAKVSISGFGSFSVNGGAFDTSPKFIRNNDIVSIRINTTSGTLSDFSKTYISTLRVGKRSSDWVVSTRNADLIPNPSFSFTSLTNREVRTAYTSNTITLLGMEPGVAIPITAIAGLGSFSVNGGSFIFSGNIQNGNTLTVKQFSSNLYSTQVSTNILVGSFSTTFSITTRAVDLNPDQFTFTDQTGVAFNTVIESNSVVISGIDTGFSGVATVTGSPGAEIQIEDSLGNVIFPYTSASLPIQRTNKLKTRVRSSTQGSTVTTSTVTIGNVSDTFSVTTRVPIARSIPDQFTFTDLTGQPVNSTVNSNSITLSGMTSGAFGSASISNGTFSVTRSGTTTSNLTSFNVQNGDVIRLTTVTPSSIEQSKDIIFSVSGTDNTTLPAVPGTVSDIWNVRTLEKDCQADGYSNAIYTDAPPGVSVDFGFTATGFEDNCSMKLSTDTNAFFGYVFATQSDGTVITGMNGVPVVKNLGIGHRLISSPSYGDSRSATMTLKSDFRPSGTSWRVTVVTKQQDIVPTISFITAGPGDQISDGSDDNLSDGFWDWRDPNSSLLKYRAVRPTNNGGPYWHSWRFTISGYDYSDNMAFQWQFTDVFGKTGALGNIGWYGDDVRSGFRRTDLASTTNTSINTWIVPTSNVATGYFQLQGPATFRPSDNPPLGDGYFGQAYGLKLRVFTYNSSTGQYEDKGLQGSAYSFGIRAATLAQYNNRIADGRWSA